MVSVWGSVRSRVGEKPHFAGHRVADISFRRGWVKCDCGAEFKVKIEPEAPVEIGHDALAAVFAAHRKSMGVAGKAH